MKFLKIVALALCAMQANIHASRAIDMIACARTQVAKASHYVLNSRGGKMAIQGAVQASKAVLSNPKLVACIALAGLEVALVIKYRNRIAAALAEKVQWVKANPVKVVLLLAAYAGTCVGVAKRQQLAGLAQQAIRSFADLHVAQHTQAAVKNGVGKMADFAAHQFAECVARSATAEVARDLAMQAIPVVTVAIAGIPEFNELLNS